MTILCCCENPSVIGQQCYRGDVYSYSTIGFFLATDGLLVLYSCFCFNSFYSAIYFFIAYLRVRVYLLVLTQMRSVILSNKRT